MATMPREFFDKYVLRAFNDFCRNPNDEYLAITAVTYANIMAEWMWHHCKGTSHVYGAVTESQYRDALTSKECGDFGLLRDVADGFKHVRLTQRPKSRRVSSADQTGAKPVRWMNATGEEVTWLNDAGDKVTWVSAIIIELDDGSTRPLLSMLADVVAMWDRLSQQV